MNTLKLIHKRISTYLKNTKHTEIIPLQYATIFVIVVVIALVFFVKPPHAMTVDYTEEQVIELAEYYNQQNQISINTINLDQTQDIPVPVKSVQIKATTTTTTIPYPEGKCSQWYPTAYQAGWPLEDLPKLGRIMWAESNCIHDIANKTYSYGLVQMEWSAHKNWLASEFGITQREELYDPYTNLLVAKWLYDYADIHYGCGWQPWYMSGDWC